jgi:LPXTG-motif cell wall-anchored protein
MPKEHLFLERRSYRMRRMMDAVRLLPVLGLCLWLVPMMWPVADPEGGGIATSTALQYIFGIWILLSLAAWFLWRRTRKAARSDAASVPLDPSGTTPIEPT